MGGRDVAESVVTQVQLSYLVVVMTQPLKDVRNLAGEETGVREVDLDQPRHHGAQIFDGDPAKRNPRELEALQVNISECCEMSEESWRQLYRFCSTVGERHSL